MAARVQAGGSGAAPSLLELKQCLLLSYLQCSERGLLHSANWYKNHHPSSTIFFCFTMILMDRAVELANSLETSDPVSLPQLEHSSEFLREFSTFWMGKSLFDLREYRRAAHALRQCTSSEAFFLRCYSLYLVSGAMDTIYYCKYPIL